MNPQDRRNRVCTGISLLAFLLATASPVDAGQFKKLQLDETTWSVRLQSGFVGATKGQKMLRCKTAMLAAKEGYRYVLFKLERTGEAEYGYQGTVVSQPWSEGTARFYAQQPEPEEVDKYEAESWDVPKSVTLWDYKPNKKERQALAGLDDDG